MVLIDSFFPYFNLTNFGCVNFNNPDYEKIELDLSKLKLLSSGDTMNQQFLTKNQMIKLNM